MHKNNPVSKVVLVSENCEEIHSLKEPEKLTTLEMSNNETTSYIVNGLKGFVQDVEIANSPKDLINFVDQDVLVMTVYGGKNSRNRMALVPAICEAADIDYIGADTYARILCQDKHLSKVFARELGLDGSPSVLIRTESDLKYIDFLKLPLVVKPNLEGSSIGIGNRSLVSSHVDARILAEELLLYFNQPILVEEFISGKEISFCLSGTANDVNFFMALEDTNKHDENFFLDKLYTADLKQNNWHDMIHVDVTDKLNSDLRRNIEQIFLSLGKMDYVRIDCRLSGDECKLIEITPDPYLGEGGAFSDAFEMSGMGYSKGLKMLINNCISSR